MKTVHMICGRYYDFERGKCTIGGIQTYMTALSGIVAEIGWECHIYQTDVVDREIRLGNTTITQINAARGMSDIRKVKRAFKRCASCLDIENDILIFTTDSRIIKNNAKKSIGIQHGISWDIPRHTESSPFFNSIYTFNRSRHTFKILERLRRVKHIVCVDYNFPNWYRAVSAYEAVKLNVIPNFTHIAPINEKPERKINIIFARRLEIYRGTRIFANVMSRVLAEQDNVFLTVAGSGPDEKYIKDKLSSFGERVIFLKYVSDQSLLIHADKHIAVIPTIGSEGTSLSLLEAMSAQCAVICSNVGGMTNVVIDGYNGLMISPCEEELYEAIIRLIKDGDLRKRLALNDYQTVKAGFSYEKWRESWKRLLQKVIAE